MTNRGTNMGLVNSVLPEDETWPEVSQSGRAYEAGVLTDAADSMRAGLLTDLKYGGRQAKKCRAADDGFGEIVGASEAIRKALELVRTVAPTNSTALIEGETGTGKELIARAIHEHSTRRDRSFVKLNCAAIPLGLLESELFRHERGAFTGAVARTIGRFERAHQGTLFLDEIGDLPLEMQPKILHALPERQVEPLGRVSSIPTDVRVRS